MNEEDIPEEYGGPCTRPLYESDVERELFAAVARASAARLRPGADQALSSSFCGIRRGVARGTMGVGRTRRSISLGGSAVGTVGSGGGSATATGSVGVGGRGSSAIGALGSGDGSGGGGEDAGVESSVASVGSSTVGGVAGSDVAGVASGGVPLSPPLGGAAVTRGVADSSSDDDDDDFYSAGEGSLMGDLSEDSISSARGGGSAGQPKYNYDVIHRFINSDHF